MSLTDDDYEVRVQEAIALRARLADMMDANKGMAAERDALRARVDRAEHAAAIAEFNEKAALRRIAALDARVAKLEAALREIGREQSAKTATVAADKFQSIARAALSETVEA